MTAHAKTPSALGQLVWCPSDPALGVGLVTEQVDRRLTVHFLRLQEDRQYTTRTAEQVILRYEMGHGELVDRAQGGAVRIKKRLPDQQGVAHYLLEDGSSAAESVLIPHVRDVGAKERLASLTLTHPESVRGRVQGLMLREVGQRPGVAAVLGSRAQWLPHQVDVATRALERQPIRMLLADEVGLGKTVEAALIFAGLKQEGRAKRVLILTPEALCIQWLQEIFRKSHELLVLMDSQRIDDAETDFPGLNPFEAHQRMVASIDRISADPVLAAHCAQAPWDLVIVDEAHHLRWKHGEGGNLAYRLVEDLAQKSQHLLLLTATPMALDPTEYHVLLRLLDKQRFDDPGMFEDVAQRARSIRDVARALAQNVADQTPVAPTDADAAKSLFLDDAEDTDLLQEFLQQAPQAATRAHLLPPILAGLQARHGLADFVTRNRRGPVGGLPARKAQIFPLPISPEQELLIEVGEEVMFELAQSIEAPQERARVIGELLRALWATPRALIDILSPYSEDLAAQLLPHVRAVTQAPLDAQGLPSKDARLAWLVQQIRALPPQEKLLVFVESAIAVRALRDTLEPLLSGKVASFHRDLSPRDQDRQVAWFRDADGPQVMLSTEAGGEGRNFQFCHRVVLYDLPWRPATVEQRIGRVDRVGQKHDVHVLVPHFVSGFEAAIVKIMHQAIGVLDRTVGGIDHALEYVSFQLAELILAGQGAVEWKELYQQTATLVSQAQARIAADVDPVLDHASFSRERVAAVLQDVPADLEARLESFVQRYAEHNKIDFHSKAGQRFAVEGAPSAAGSIDADAFVATFRRDDALDHEDVEFLSFGHPLVEQALDWAQNGHDASAALALCRGFDREGAAFLWTFALDVAENAREVMPYFRQTLWTVALDEGGSRRPELESLLAVGARPLDRMDPTPLRGSIERWRMLVENNHESLERLAQTEIAQAVAGARAALDAAMAERGRHLRRAAMRRLLKKGQPAGAADAQDPLAAHDKAHQRLLQALQDAQPKLISVIAVRLMRTRHVSA